MRLVLARDGYWARYKREKELDFYGVRPRGVLQ